MGDNARVRTAIEEAGGLVSLSGVAAAWDVSKQAVAQHVDKDDFPKPLWVDNGDTQTRVWPREEILAWRRSNGR